ncbi:hypothetical protein ACUV84_001129 [Puccinellia chinampoensis]
MVRVIVCGNIVFTVPSSSHRGDQFRGLEEGVDVQRQAADAARLRIWRICVRSATATMSFVMLAWLFVMRYLYKDPDYQDLSTLILGPLCSLAPTVFMYMVTREDEATYT